MKNLNEVHWHDNVVLTQTAKFLTFSFYSLIWSRHTASRILQTNMVNTNFSTSELIMMFALKAVRLEWIFHTSP